MFDMNEFKTRLAAIPGDGVAKRAAQFLLIRKELEKLDEEHEKVKSPLLQIKSLLEGYFEQTLTTTGAQNIVTQSGTIHWNNRVTASLEDPQAFMDHVITNQEFDLLDRRANAGAVTEYATKHGALPPGVKINRIRTIGVNKPGAKAKAKGG